MTYDAGRSDERYDLNIVVAGQKYSPKDILALREQMIQLRDTALGAGYMEWALVLSHNISILARIAEVMT